MDNIIDYLVVIFFIISFLSSIFKKKKPTPAKGKVNVSAPPKAVKRVPANNKKAINPFDDFFKSIEQNFEEPAEEKKISEVDLFFEEAMKKSEEFETKEPEVEIYQETTPIIPQTEIQSDSIKSYTDSVSESKKKRESAIAENIIASLKDKNSLKNFIIMNEILGKPKALQR